jgi:hypothetical protein
MATRIKLSHKRGEVAENTWDDIAWIRQNRHKLYQDLGAVVVLVYHQAVIGKGKSLEEAVADAESHLTSETEEISPVIEFLSPAPRISRFVPNKGE